MGQLNHQRIEKLCDRTNEDKGKCNPILGGVKLA
jgi:hypothetical protein